MQDKDLDCRMRSYETKSWGYRKKVLLYKKRPRWSAEMTQKLEKKETYSVRKEGDSGPRDSLTREVTQRSEDSGPGCKSCRRISRGKKRILHGPSRLG